jgi:hypothetical protein
VVVGLVLDADSGLILGSGAAGSARQALEQCLRSALASGAPPAHLICQPGRTTAVRAAAKAVGLASPVLGAELPLEAEDILDSMLGDLGGYRSNQDPPSPAAWAALMSATHDFLETAPWIRVPDTVALPAELRVGGRTARYRAVVLGQAEVETGLLLVPEGSAPISELNPAALPEGALGIVFMAEKEMPVASRRAHRFGWPTKLGLVPMFFCAQKSSGGEPSQEQADHLLLALAAVQAFDKADHIARLRGSVKGLLRLPDGPQGRFRLAPAEDISASEPPTDPWGQPSGPTPVNLGLRSGLVRDDLVPKGAMVHVGGVMWEMVAALRSRAELHTDSPVPQTRSASGLPILAIECNASSGVKLARRLLEAEPMGLVPIDDGGELMLALLCREDIYGMIVMPSKAPETLRFRSRLVESGGDHAILVAKFDGASPKRIFGFFECHLDSNPPVAGRRQGSRRPKPRRRR